MGKNSGAIKAAFVSCEGEDTKSPTVESTRNNKIVCRGTEEVVAGGQRKSQASLLITRTPFWGCQPFPKGD